MLNFIACHGFSETQTSKLQAAVSKELSYPLTEQGWIDTRLVHAGPRTLLNSDAFVSASMQRFEDQAKMRGGEILGSWVVMIMPDTAPTGMMLAFARAVERRTGNPPGIIIVEQAGQDVHVIHVSDLPLRARCHVGDTLVVIRNIWLHHEDPFLPRGSKVTITALDGPCEKHYSNCVVVVDEEGEQLLLPWCLVVPLSEWADGAYPNGAFGKVPPQIYPPLTPPFAA